MFACLKPFHSKPVVVFGLTFTPIHPSVVAFYFQRALVETNPYLLGITMIVTLIHTVFEFLAFKNGKLILW